VNPLLARSLESGALPRVALEFESRTAGHSIWRMSQVLALVGSSGRCKVRLFDSNVSKLHCALLRTTCGLWVVDLLGRGGITVNGSAARFARLGAGDVLGLGQVVVRPTFEEPAAPGGPASGVWGGPPAPGAGLPERQTPRPWSGLPTPGFLPPARPSTGTDLSIAGGDPALAMLLNHSAQMQQQMLDQFQNWMMMMMQMFGGMHREQMAMVREEFNHVRELSQEIATLKAQLATAPSRAQQPPHAPSQPFRAGPQPAGWGMPSAPAPPSAPTSSAPGTNGQHPHPGAAARPPGPAREPGQGGPQPPPPRSVKPPPSEPAPDIHDWLSERLNAIEQEQQTRIQKIMNLIRGNR
jgi:hypothetical protein